MSNRPIVKHVPLLAETRNLQLPNTLIRWRTSPPNWCIDGGSTGYPNPCGNLKHITHLLS